MARKSAKRTVVPYQQPADRFGVIRGSRYRRIPPKLVTDKGGVEVLDADNFAEKFPQLAEAARRAAEARMLMYGLPDTEMDKFHGWIEDPNYNRELLSKFPEELRGELKYSPEGKFYVLNKESRALDDYEPEQVAAILNFLSRDFPEGIPPKTALKHVHRDDVPEGAQFYPSTQQYLNDVLFSGGFAEADPVVEQTYDLARNYLQDMFIRDTQLPPENRSYSKQARKMLGKGDDEEYTIQDLAKYFEKPIFGQQAEFDATPNAGYYVQNMLDPARAKVTQDPELERKTSEKEKMARTAYDIGKLALMGPVGELGFRGLAKNFMYPAMHPVLARAGYGAGLGAAMSPIDYLVGDNAFDYFTGSGVTHHPFDVSNVVADAVIGAATSGVAGALDPSGHGRFLARQRMVSQPSGSEALGNLKAIATEQGIPLKKMGKLVTKEMLEDELSGVPHHPTSGETFARKAWVPYDKEWNTVWKVEPPPKPEVKLEEGAVELKPYGETGVPGTYKLTEEPVVNQEGTGITYSKPKFNQQTQMQEITVTRKTPDGRTEKYVVPHAYGKPTNQFMSRYFSEHPELLEDMPAEFSTDMQDWLSRVVPYGDYPERRWFYGNKPIFMTDEERRVLQNMSKDATGAQKAKAAYVDKNKQLGTKDKKSGEWKPASEEQTKAYEKAKKEYKLRSNLRELTPDEMTQFKESQVGPVRKAGALGVNTLVRPALINSFPSGSFIMDKLTGQSTIPYSYEAYPEEK